jgi:hypothetical protein
MTGANGGPTGGVVDGTSDAYNVPTLRALNTKVSAVRLADLTAGHLDRMYSQIRRDHPNVTPATIQRVHRTLRSAIRMAVKRGEVKHDVTAHVELP